MPSVQLLQQRQYIYYNDNNGLGYGARIGIGIGIAVAVLAAVFLVGLAKKNRMRNSSVNAPSTGNYVPQSGYSNGHAGQNYQQGAYPNSGWQGGYPEPQGQPSSYGYPPPQGPPPPLGEQEMVDGHIYAPPTAPPPAYNTTKGSVNV